MRKLLVLLAMPAILFCICGCDIPYKEEYQKAMEAKEQAEQKVAEAEKIAADAQEALTAEQRAMERIYVED